MALHNEILVGRFNRFVQKLFQLKGGPPAPQLSSEIQMQQGIFHGAENRYIESWNRFASGFFQNLLAGNNSAWMLRNPTGSNVVGVVERLSFSSSVADPGAFIDQDTGTAGLSTGIGVRCLDNRPVGGKTTTLGATLQVSAQNTFVATGAVIARVALQASVDYNFIVTENQEITLLPGDVLEVVTSVVATNLAVNLIWRERFLEDSERT
jgi:hypothetical protein